MKTRSKIELSVVLTVITAKAWSAQQQFAADGALSVILFGGIALAATIMLLRRSSTLAFLLAMGATFSAFSLARAFLFVPGQSLISAIAFTREEAIYLVFAGCLFDLWTEWRTSEAALAEAKQR